MLFITLLVFIPTQVDGDLADNAKTQFLSHYVAFLQHRYIGIMSLSSVDTITDCHAFKEIIAGGISFLPFIMEMIKEGDFYLNRAMEAITGINIRDHYKVDKSAEERNVSKLWIRWWHERPKQVQEDTADNTKTQFLTHYAAYLQHREKPEIYFSSSTDIINDCRAFRAIVAGGKPFLPFIMGKIEEGDFFLNSAMKAITGIALHEHYEMYVSGEQSVSELWIRWWYERSIQLDSDFADDTKTQFLIHYSEFMHFRGMRNLRSKKVVSATDCHAFNEIIAGGKPFLPFIIERIERHDIDLNGAMEAITGINIENHYRIDVIDEHGISELWIIWWHENGKAIPK